MSGNPVRATLRWCAEESLVFADTDSPFRVEYVETESPVTVIAGENASGKSLLFRLAAAVMNRDHDTLAITISIRERTGSGSSEMSGMRRAFMFGDETDQSTGAVSTRVTTTGFKNLTSDSKAHTALLLDEPEIGLSEGYARALGEFVGRNSAFVPKQCAGVVVVTHSRNFVRGLIDGLGHDPSFAYCGDTEDGPGDLRGWLDATEHKTVEQLLALPEIGLRRFRATETLLKDQR